MELIKLLCKKYNLEDKSNLLTEIVNSPKYKESYNTEILKEMDYFLSLTDIKTIEKFFLSHREFRKKTENKNIVLISKGNINASLIAYILGVTNCNPRDMQMSFFSLYRLPLRIDYAVFGKDRRSSNLDEFSLFDNIESKKSIKYTSIRTVLQGNRFPEDLKAWITTEYANTLKELIRLKKVNTDVNSIEDHIKKFEMIVNYNKDLKYYFETLKPELYEFLKEELKKIRGNFRINEFTFKDSFDSKYFRNSFHLSKVNSSYRLKDNGMTPELILRAEVSFFLKKTKQFLTSELDEPLLRCKEFRHLSRYVSSGIKDKLADYRDLLFVESLESKPKRWLLFQDNSFITKDKNIISKDVLNICFYEDVLEYFYNISQNENTTRRMMSFYKKENKDDLLKEIKKIGLKEDVEATVDYLFFINNSLVYLYNYLPKFIEKSLHLYPLIKTKSDDFLLSCT